ncbi:hypothetical protein [Asticcacaulis sp. YBE204]|uniref:hypothetical protein n=1 Tax=Asticcacaulis sp. YBE204 TaxID=1282363 RepID=UPI0012DEEEA8|nr:hypothetical protein [Asticcacaulis sp. YBE204]
MVVLVAASVPRKVYNGFRKQVRVKLSDRQAVGAGPGDDHIGEQVGQEGHSLGSFYAYRGDLVRRRRGRETEGQQGGHEFFDHLFHCHISTNKEFSGVSRENRIESVWRFIVLTTLS